MSPGASKIPGADPQLDADARLPRAGEADHKLTARRSTAARRALDELTLDGGLAAMHVKRRVAVFGFGAV